jgi:hypothetical protein
MTTTQTLAYSPLEPIQVPRPVDRIEYIVSRCAGARVLDLGCYDETALVKRDTETWLHGRIAAVAAAVLGIDSSEAIPPDGLVTGPNSRIVRGDARAFADALGTGQWDVAVAGELIEHLPNALEFLLTVKAGLAGRRLILSTPNATSLTNALLGAAGRESNHPDHLQVFSFKTLNTLCLRAGFASWTIVPYFVRYSEMILRARGARRAAVKGAERLVNLWERAFPLHAGGLILDVDRV